jgi:hypothetical protein
MAFAWMREMFRLSSIGKADPSEPRSSGASYPRRRGDDPFNVLFAKSDTELARQARGRHLLTLLRCQVIMRFCWVCTVNGGSSNRK